jgi:hypothetical protein
MFYINLVYLELMIIDTEVPKLFKKKYLCIHVSTDSRSLNTCKLESYRIMSWYRSVSITTRLWAEQPKN